MSRPTTSRRSSRFDKDIQAESPMQRSSSQGSISTAVPSPARRSTRSSGGEEFALRRVPPLPPLRQPRRLDKGKGRAVTPVRESSNPYTPAQHSPSSERTHGDSPEWSSPSLPPHPSPPIEDFIELTPPPPFLRTDTSSPAPSLTRPSSNDIQYPLPDTISVKVHFRCGERHTQPRARKTLPLPVEWDYKWDYDNFNVLCSRIRGVTNGLQRFKWPSNSQPYCKPNHHAGQDNYKALDEATCDIKLKVAWKNEARRQKKSGGIDVHVFVYLADDDARSGAQGQAGGPSVGTGEVFRRATKARAEAAEARLNREIEEGHLEPYGDMSRPYLRTHFARRDPPGENERLRIPTTRAFTQIRNLDSEAEAVNNRTEAKIVARQQVFKKIRVRVGTVVFPIEVHVVDFKDVLELPDMNLNGLPNFRAGDGSDDLEGPAIDMPDEDHA